MRHIFVILSLWAVSLLASPATVAYAEPFLHELTGSMQPEDTIVIISAGKGKITILLESAKDLEKLKHKDLAKFLEDISTVVDASANRDTVIKRANAEYTIVYNGSGIPQIAVKPVATTVIKEEPQVTTIKSSRNQRKKRFNRNISLHATLDLGFNNILTPSNQIPSGEEYDLNAFGSRYASIHNRVTFKLHRYVDIHSGIDVSWNNFMFENNIAAVSTPAGIVFQPDTRDVRKSKLVATYVSIPLMLEIHSGRAVGVSAGGYAGYRVSSYSAVKYNEGDRRHTDRDHANFGLNPFRYGLTAQLRVFSKAIFVNYDLSTLFEANRGPELNTFSIGFRLL